MISTPAESGPGEEGNRTSQLRASLPTASCSHCLPAEDNRDKGDEPSNSQV